MSRDVSYENRRECALKKYNNFWWTKILICVIANIRLLTLQDLLVFGAQPIFLDNLENLSRVFLCTKTTEFRLWRKHFHNVLNLTHVGCKLHMCLTYFSLHFSSWLLSTSDRRFAAS